MSILGDFIKLLTFLRDKTRLKAERHRLAVESLEKLRTNLKYRLESELDAPMRYNLDVRLKATEAALTQLHQRMALDDPLVRNYYLDNLRVLVPREIGPQAQLPQPVRETAALAGEASQAAGATPTDAEGYLLLGNALYFRSERLEGTAIAQALTSAIQAYDHALEVRTRNHFPYWHTHVQRNRDTARRLLEERNR